MIQNPAKFDIHPFDGTCFDEWETPTTITVMSNTNEYLKESPQVKLSGSLFLIKSQKEKDSLYWNHNVNFKSPKSLKQILKNMTNEIKDYIEI